MRLGFHQPQRSLLKASQSRAKQASLKCCVDTRGLTTIALIGFRDGLL